MASVVAALLATLIAFYLEIRRRSCDSGSMKTPIRPLIIAVGFLSLTANADAVIPPPDGAYPGGNTAEGQAALLSRTTGGFNTAIGWLSLRSDTTDSFNTGVGAGALLANTADENTATGAGALLSNTTAGHNTATGAFALFSNTIGNFNTATGNGALSTNTTGAFNTANGFESLFSNTVGTTNTASGLNALFANTTGSFNTAIGAAALLSNTTGSSNIALGLGAGGVVTTASNVVAIGSPGGNLSNSCFIGNIRGVTVNNAVPVLIDPAGQLGTVSSSRQFKKEIKPMDNVSDAILALKPVTFHYKSDKSGTPQFGLIAEEVAAVNPDLVVRDEKGDIYTVRYDAVNAMLLNEFLKEHKAFLEERHKVQGLEANAAEQRKAIQALATMVKQQASQIEKVSAQLELSTAARQTVLNSR